MRPAMKIVTLSIAYLLPVAALGQECTALRSATVEDAAEYLQAAAGRSTSAACVQLAFQLIAASPTEQAVPLLIENLGLKRPLNNGERRGIFMHGNTPENLYPAIHELFTIGPPAEPKLIRFISHTHDEKDVERHNALYALLLIHHGNAMGVIDSLMKVSKATVEAGDSGRLRAAAADVASKWCDERIRQRCEDALR
jgi:hypothetical protein